MHDEPAASGQVLAGNRLEADGLSVAVDGRLLINPLSLTLAAGELVALIGPSGAGKTTLLRALCGALPPYEGDVLLGGSPLARASVDIGYVPGDDLLHPELSLVEELYYAAALRARGEVSPVKLEQRVNETLSDLNLTELADARVATLSKGQLRRAACGVELVGRPAMLLLDEPAGGLDPQLERRLMELLRGLADSGRGVLVATHATASLELCDRVIALGDGGILRYDGPPQELADAFGADTIDLVYGSLEGTESDRTPPEVPWREPRMRPPREPGSGFRRQLPTLTSRAVVCRLRDARSLAILIGQVPLLGLAIAVVLPRGAVNDDSLGPYYGVLLSFMLLTAAIWLGTISACREIVNEQAVIRREAAVGVSSGAQLLAGCIATFPLVALQTALLGLVVMILQPAGPGAGLLIVMTVVAGCSAACMGLWLSAASRTSDQATSSVPLLLIPQLLFAGALVPVSRMPAPLHLLSDICIGRWALSGIGGAIHLDERLGSTLTGVTGLQGGFFGDAPLTPIAVMTTIGAASLLGAAWSLRRGLDR